MSSEKSDRKSQDEYSFKTVFGLNEEAFVRTAAKGNYVPVVHEFEKLILEKKVTLNEYRLLVFIKSKTINFWNTHTRMTRKQIYQDLGMAKPKFYDALKVLTQNQYILEKKDEGTDYYFYAINPTIFGGTIVLRSISDAPFRLNKSEKYQKGILQKRNKGTKKGSEKYQKGTEWVTKWYPEDELITRDYSGFEILKYILLKYILLNGISAAKSQETINLLEQTKNPEYMMKCFVSLMQKQPLLSRGMVEELFRANREQKDVNGRQIQTNAVAYLLSSWDQVKHHWQNLDHKVDMTTEAIDMRKAMADLVSEYPIEDNVVQFKKAAK